MVLADINLIVPMYRIESGIGLSSVTVLVEKYRGSLDYQEGDGVF